MAAEKESITTYSGVLFFKYTWQQLKIFLTSTGVLFPKCPPDGNTEWFFMMTTRECYSENAHQMAAENNIFLLALLCSLQDAKNIGAEDEFSWCLTVRFYSQSFHHMPMENICWCIHLEVIFKIPTGCQQRKMPRVEILWHSQYSCKMGAEKNFITIYPGVLFF